MPGDNLQRKVIYLDADCIKQVLETCEILRKHFSAMADDLSDKTELQFIDIGTSNYNDNYARN